MKKISVCILILLFLGSIVSVSAQTATINANTVQQYIRGFGGANIRGWRDDLTSSQRITAFSVEEGLGLSICRVRVSPNSSDWEGEKATIDAAKSCGALVIATSWTAPASMKTNNSTVGGKLKTSSYSSYAAHLRDYVETVGGVDAISPVNEPNYRVNYESMEMSGYEVAAFVAAQGDNCGAPIMAPEPYNMSQAYFNDYLRYPGVKGKTAYLAGHIYGASPYYYNAGMEVWMTEHYVDSSADANNWSIAMRAGKEIHDCMNCGYSAYVWWYLCRYYGPIDENGRATKTGYVMSQYAKYVRPGFNKISCTASPRNGVHITAYKKDSDLVIVAINQNSSSVTQSFSLSGMSVSGFTTYTTSGSANHSRGSISASGSSFSASLPGSSITTLVSGGGSITTPRPTSTPATEGNIMVKARGTVGGEILELHIEDDIVATWNMSASYQDFYAEGWGTPIEVHFINDDQAEHGMDIQVDYLQYNDITYQAEDQEINTAVYQDGSCGGSYSDMLECNGYIRFDVEESTPAPSPTPTPGSPENVGDVNNDDIIDILDALMTSQAYVGLNPEGFVPERADVDCDNEITIVDALKIARYYIGLISSLDC